MARLPGKRKRSAQPTRIGIEDRPLQLHAMGVCRSNNAELGVLVTMGPANTSLRVPVLELSRVWAHRADTRGSTIGR